jgi:hypothetical protein
LQDCRIASWGNSGTVHYTQLYQFMVLNRLLDWQLYAGVTRVVVGVGLGRFFRDGLKRCQILQIGGAECLRAAVPLCGAGTELNGAAQPVASSDDLARIEAGFAPDIAYVQAYHAEVFAPLGLPPLSEPLLAATLEMARRRGKPSWVVVGNWDEVARASALGATVVHGLPPGAPPEATLRLLIERGTHFAPLLAPIEMAEIRGPDSTLLGPLAASLVRPDIVETYRDPSGYESGAKALCALGAQVKPTLPSLLKGLAESGVPLLVASDSGALPGVFQGLAVHRALHWLAWAGVEGWDRLRAATHVPARLLSRLTGFSPGAPADFVVLGRDPLGVAHDEPEIDAVCRNGRWVERGALAPDLVRRRYPL